MTIAYPFDLLSGFPGWTTEFQPQWRQEQSRQGSGRTYLKDFGSPLWQMSAQSRSLSINDLDYWRARLDAMENGAQTFLGYATSRCRPIRHPGSSALPAGTLASIATNRKVVTLAGLVGVTLAIGDMFQIGTTDLHRIADIDGANLEVRPHLWPGVAAGAAVSIERPHCVMAIVPGSIQSPADPVTGRGTVSFKAVEAR